MTSRILPFFAILIAIVVTIGYTRPVWSGSIADTRARIESYDAALAAATRFQQKEAELTQAKSAISPESLARLEAFLPDGVDNVQLILDLDALAARSGVTLSNFDVSGQGDGEQAVPGVSGSAPGAAGMPAGAPPTGSTPGSLGGGLSLSAGTPVDSIELTLTATGSYNAFRRFLGGIEQSLRPLDVVSLKVEPGETGVYNYDMTIRLYWLR